MKLNYLLVLIVFLCLQSAASSVIRVKAVGLASPEITPGTRARATALRAAKIMGYKKLALAAGIDIKGEALLKGARVVKTTFISDYKVQVVMEIHLPLPKKRRGPETKKAVYLSEIARLKNDIKAIKNKTSTLDKQLKKMEKKFKTLEQKINSQESRK